MTDREAIFMFFIFPPLASIVTLAIAVSIMNRGEPERRRQFEMQCDSGDFYGFSQSEVGACRLRWELPK